MKVRHQEVSENGCFVIAVVLLITKEGIHTLSNAANTWRG